MKLLVNRLPGVPIRLGALVKMGVVGTAYPRRFFMSGGCSGRPASGRRMFWAGRISGRTGLLARPDFRLRSAALRFNMTGL